jgi:hypothetical protein
MQAVRRRQSYKETMWRHLADYKVSVLGIHSNGIWKKNKREYPHILPIEKRNQTSWDPIGRSSGAGFGVAQFTGNVLQPVLPVRG